jgi:hypothetical protein
VATRGEQERGGAEALDAHQILLAPRQEDEEVKTQAESVDISHYYRI